MRVFLTGATGYIGSAVLDALLRGRHEVVALVRDPRSAERLARRDVASVLGELARPATYLDAAESAEAIVHTAYEKSKVGPDTDRQALEAFLEVAARRRRAGAATTLVYTSGVWVLGPTQGQATEDAPLRPTELAAWRPAHEQIVREAAVPDAIRTVVLRPGIVYGGARGIVGDLLNVAFYGMFRIVLYCQLFFSCL
jgi:nucleoside-diphosphate-sugar epimerase